MICISFAYRQSPATAQTKGREEGRPGPATPDSKYARNRGIWTVIKTRWKVPLVFLGYYHGQKKPAYENPVRTNQIHRQIPEQQWFMNSMTSMLMAGILPFGAVFIELFFIFTGNISKPASDWRNDFLRGVNIIIRSWDESSILISFRNVNKAIWENEFYYLFGFLFLVFIILIVACSQISIVMTYFQVYSEKN